MSLLEKSVYSYVNVWDEEEYDFKIVLFSPNRITIWVSRCVQPFVSNITIAYISIVREVV